MMSSEPAHELERTGNAGVLSLYQGLLPAPFLEQLQRRIGVPQNNRVYNALVVMWLMIAQRLQHRASLQTAVLELLRGLPSTFWPQPCQRLLDWRQHRKILSSHTGAYNKARQTLSTTVVEQSCDRIFEQLTARLDGTLLPLGVRAFFVDGTSVRLARSQPLRQCYPPGSNQHGEAHWPLLRMLVAHDLQTGLAMRPQWGPMHGSHAVSEQQLLDAAMDRLPSGAALVGDANFGIFWVAYAAAVLRNHPVALRLTLARAQHLQGAGLQDGIERSIVWRPSRDDRRRHPDWPADACVRGRLIVRQAQPSNGATPFLLCLFTTLRIDRDEVLKLYGQRWNIETDLRSLKSTLQMEHLSCTTPEMVAKELDMATATYNLVRAVTCLAAQRSGTPPRSYSFTRVRSVIAAFTPLVSNAKNRPEAQKCFDAMMHYVEQAKLPKRRRKRPAYPRAVWAKGERFPCRKE